MKFGQAVQHPMIPRANLSPENTADYTLELGPAGEGCDRFVTGLDLIRARIFRFFKR